MVQVADVAVVEEAQTGGHKFAAPAVAQGVGGGDDVAVLVDDGDVGSMLALLRGGLQLGDRQVAEGHRLHGLHVVHVDKGSPLGGELVD